MPVYRQDRPHTDFITSLSHHFDSIDTILSSLRGSLDEIYEVEEVEHNRVEEIIESTIALQGKSRADLVRSKYETFWINKNKWYKVDYISNQENKI